jgi:hypothetical protein
MATVTFDESFRSQRVPDGWVYPSNSPSPKSAGAIHVARLQSHRGAQRYAVRIPADASYTHVVVWCNRFHVGVAHADLRSGGKS